MRNLTTIFLLGIAAAVMAARKFELMWLVLIMLFSNLHQEMMAGGGR